MHLPRHRRAQCSRRRIQIATATDGEGVEVEDSALSIWISDRSRSLQEARDIGNAILEAVSQAELADPFVRRCLEESGPSTSVRIARIFREENRRSTTGCGQRGASHREQGRPAPEEPRGVPRGVEGTQSRTSERELVRSSTSEQRAILEPALQHPESPQGRSGANQVERRTGLQRNAKADAQRART